MEILIREHSDSNKVNIILIYEWEILNSIGFELCSLLDKHDQYSYNNKDIFLFVDYNKQSIEDFFSQKGISGANYINIMINEKNYFNPKEIDKHYGINGIIGSESGNNKISEEERKRRIRDLLHFFLLSDMNRMSNLFKSKVILSFDSYVETYPIKLLREISEKHIEKFLLSKITGNEKYIDKDELKKQTVEQLKKDMKTILESKGIKLQTKPSITIPPKKKYPIFFQFRHIKIKKIKQLKFSVESFFEKKLKTFKDELKELKKKIDTINWVEQIKTVSNEELDKINNTIKSEISLTQQKIKIIEEENTDNSWPSQPNNLEISIEGPGSYSLIAVMLIFLLSMMGLIVSKWVSIPIVISISKWILIITFLLLIIYTFLFWLIKHRKYIRIYKKNFDSLLKEINSFYDETMKSIEKLYYKFYLDTLLIKYKQREKKLLELLNFISTKIKGIDNYIEELDKTEYINNYITFLNKKETVLLESLNKINSINKFEEQLNEQVENRVLTVFTEYGNLANSSIYNYTEAMNKVKNYSIYYPEIKDKILTNTGNIILFYSFKEDIVPNNNKDLLINNINSNQSSYNEKIELDNNFIESGIEGVLIGEILLEKGDSYG